MKIKTFKQFVEPKIEKDLEGNYILNTVFGKHSIAKIKKHADGSGDILNTVMGKHSLKSKINVQEGHSESSAFFKKHDKEGQQEVHEALTSHYSKFSDNDIHAIGEYTQSSFALNRHLHANAMGEKPVKSRSGSYHDLHEKQLTAALHRHKTPEALTVYSGVHHSPEHLIKHQGGDKNKTGGIAKTSHFTSASLSARTAAGFSQEDSDSIHNKKYGKTAYGNPTHMLKIHVPKGHPGAYVDHHSSHFGEREFILPHGTKMHIHHEPEYDMSNHAMIWHARVLPHEK